MRCKVGDETKVGMWRGVEPSEWAWGESGELCVVYVDVESMAD